MMHERRSAWAGLLISLLVHGLIVFVWFHTVALAITKDAPKDNEVQLRLENFQPQPLSPPVTTEACPAPVVEEPEPIEITEPLPEPEPVPEKPVEKETPVVKTVQKKEPPKKEPVKKVRKPKRSQATKVKATQPKTNTPPSQPTISAAASPSVPSAAETRAALERRVIRRLLALIEQERIYPYSARRMGLNGKAEIVVTLTPGGRISGFNVASASHGVFKKAAMTTMKKVAGRNEQLDPGLSDSIRVRVPLVFTLKE